MDTMCEQYARQSLLITCNHNLSIASLWVLNTRMTLPQAAASFVISGLASYSIKKAIKANDNLYKTSLNIQKYLSQLAKKTCDLPQLFIAGLAFGSIVFGKRHPAYWTSIIALNLLTINKNYFEFNKN